MPPHCDARDGPVVKAAEQSLAKGNVNEILPFAPASAAQEITRAFLWARSAMEAGPAGARVAKEWFAETAVRLHRAGEGQPFTGLKPAGLDVGPVLPLAERALEERNVDDVVTLLTQLLEDRVRSHFRAALNLSAYRPYDVAHARAYVSERLGFLVDCHGLFRRLTAPTPHAGPGNTPAQHDEHEVEA